MKLLKPSDPSQPSIKYFEFSGTEVFQQSFSQPATQKPAMAKWALIFTIVFATALMNYVSSQTLPVTPGCTVPPVCTVVDGVDSCTSNQAIFLLFCKYYMADNQANLKCCPGAASADVSVCKCCPKSAESCTNTAYTFAKFPSTAQNKREKYLLAILAVLVYNHVVSFILTALMIAHDSQGAIFLGNLVPEKYYVFPIPLLVGIIQCYLYLICHIIFLLSCTAIIVYSYYVTPFLTKKLRRRTKTNGTKNSFSLPKSKKIQHVYRCLQLLQANVFGVIGIFVVILNASYMLAIIFCNFVMIRYWSDLKIAAKSALLIWTIFFTGFWCTVMELGRFYFLKGTKTINSWKGGGWGDPKENKLMRKFVKSCKPIVIGYGKQFVLGRVSIIVFFRGVGRGIFRALLTTKK
ncbi:unnamed protein product [Orchesella dallaii]|uniref:Uncharacterized protein n=1 Tax=Orchesella dallaii TaxID=48710 RepID=A0ABP1PNZ0_9HEXA